MYELQFIINFQIAVAVYSLLVACMWWRSMAHFYEYLSTGAFFACLGGALFNLSDFILVLDDKVLVHGQTIYMMIDS